MRHGFVAAALAGLMVSFPALAQSPIPLHSGPGYSTVTPEMQFPAPEPSYVWQPGHWSWSGVQYVWEPGRYVEAPRAAAAPAPGHWERRANGWVWVEDSSNYPGVGTSAPPNGYPSGR